jgi:hypothetical protein
MQLTFGTFGKSGRCCWLFIGPCGGWKWHRYATSEESETFGPRVSALPDDHVIVVGHYAIYRSLCLEHAL